MKYFEYNNGDKMPMVGLGTWKMTDGIGFTAVKSAIDAGYRHIDAAWIYRNEADVGRGINESIESGVATRDDLWVTSKLWNDKHRGQQVAGALKDQLVELQLEYLNLYLMHWPVAHQVGVMRPDSGDQFLSLDEVPLTETWAAMIECKQAGLCKHIGVANFNAPKIDQLIDSSGVAPACNQVEAHPLLQQNALLKYCNEKEIALVAYSPLGSGDRPEPMRKEDEPNLLTLPAVVEIAQALQITAAQVLLAWAIERGTIPIPKSSNPERQRENLAAADIELSADQLKQLSTLDRQYRFIDGTVWTENDGPYTLAGLWDQ